jgi:hypothetical protein
MRPFNVDPVSNLAGSYYKIAKGYGEYYCKNRDPNIVVRAVCYLAQLAVPSGEDTTWFDNGLLILLELACPNALHDEASLRFLKDIQAGITEVKASIYDQNGF